MGQVLEQNLSLNRISKGSVVDACSRIGQFVSEMGLTGLDALMMEQHFYNALYEGLLLLHAPSNALEYVEVRHNSVSYQIDLVKSCEPDLFEQDARTPVLAMQA